MRRTKRAHVLWVGVLFLVVAAVSGPAAVSAETVSGYLDGTDRTAWHSVTLTTDGVLELNITVDASLDLNRYDGVRVYNSDKTKALESFNGPDGSTAVSGTYGPVALQAGTYYVRLYQNSGSGNYSLNTRGNGQPLANDVEPNDDYGNAQAAVLNGSVTGHLGYKAGDNSVDGQDWWTVTLAGDGELSLGITIDATLNLNGSSYVKIYGQDGSCTIEGYSGPGGGSDVTGSYGPVPLRAGTYYIRVYRKDGYGGYTLSTTFTAQPLADDSEPNDGFADAQAAALNGSVTGHLGYMGGGACSTPDKQDWWKITLAGDGALSLSVSIDPTLNLNSSTYVQVYDQNGSCAIKGYAGPAGGSDVTGSYGPLALKAGSYYIRLYRKDGYGGYTLSTTFTAQPLADDSEPNDTYATAAALTVGGSVTGHLGHQGGGGCTGADEEDWWKVTLGSDGGLTLGMTIDATLNLNSSSRIQIYDQDGSCAIVGYGGPAGNSDVSGSYGPQPLKAGVYYIKIRRYEGYGGYTLSTTFAAQTLAIDAEPNDAYATAVSVLPGDNATGHLGYQGGGSCRTADEEDWWKVTLADDGDLTLDVTIDAALSMNYSNRIQVYDHTGSRSLAGFAGPAGASDVTGSYGPVALQAGDYFVKMQRYEGYGGYRFMPLFTAQALAGDPEPNDACSQSLDMAVDETVSGHLGFTGEGAFTDTQDWWSLTLPADGELLLGVRIDAGLSMDCYDCIGVYDNSTETPTIQRFTGPAGDRDTAGIYGPVPLQAGTYCIQAKRNDGSGGYELNAGFTPQTCPGETEPNDSFEYARVLAFDDEVSGHLGYLGGSGSTPDGQDWWTMELGSAADVTFVVSGDRTLNLGGSYAFSLLDAERNRIERFAGPAGGAETEVTYGPVSLEAGVYYLQISLAEGYGCYHLLATTETVITTSTTSVSGGGLPACLEVRPGEVARGETTLVEISGSDTGFSAGATSVYFDCAGVFVNSVEVKSATQVVAEITVSSSASEGACDVLVTTGAEEVLCTEALQITAAAEQAYTKAIIVAGGGPYSGNALWEPTAMLADYAYKVLQYQGLGADDIMYLTYATDSDVDGDGSVDADDVPTREALQDAITVWAADADSVLIYCIDHGGDGTFRIGELETVSAEDDFKAWLDNLEGVLPEDGTIVFVYDACKSGSFLPILKSDRRILITSAADDEPAYFVTGGMVSFSHYFWSGVFDGNALYDAFTNAKNAMHDTGFQTALLDDDGDGEGNEKEDGDKARDRKIGRGKISGADFPSVGRVCEEQTLYRDNTATIWVENIVDADQIVMVWALVRAPDSEVDDPENPVLNMPSFVLAKNGENRYEGTFSDFSAEGTYELAIYAMDEDGYISLPVITQVHRQSVCPLQNILGLSNERVAAFARLRDDVLQRSGMGRRFVRAYYKNAGDINAFFDRHPAVRASAKRILELVAPAVDMLLDE